MIKVIKQHAHQGDTQFYRIDGIPSGAKKVDKQYIAASERSGSFHALFGDYDMYEVEDGFVLDVKGECVLNHSLEQELKGTGVSMHKATVLPKKDHRHTVLSPGIYAVGIQNRFDPLEAIKKRVID